MGQHLSGLQEPFSTNLSSFPRKILNRRLFLIISACPNDCVSIPAFDGPVVHIANNTLNGHRFTIEEMPEAIVKAILHLLGRSIRVVLGTTVSLRVVNHFTQETMTWKKSLLLGGREHHH